MFDIGFVELLLCSVIALLVLGPERLPVAARAAGRWIGKARRMTRTFTGELERQLKADELREKIRKEGSELGAEDIQRNFRQGLDQARKYTDYLVSDEPPSTPAPSSTTTSEGPGQADAAGTSSEAAATNRLATEAAERRQQAAGSASTTGAVTPPDSPAGEKSQETKH